MKEGYLLKRKTEHGVVSPQELEKINQYTRREFQAQELYTFSVVLCDNQVDRDFECFTKAALEKLKELFLGKTGIFDHSMRSGGQTARIYDCRVETLPERKNQLGEPYSRLVARAYLPRTAKNQDFITELDSGIKKEVSVGCAVNRLRCSICGEDLKKGACRHQKGKTYDGRLCCTVLDDPYDAYEWSFVAVPAQREAGVLKRFGQESRGAALLEKQAALGRKYLEQLRREVVRLAMLADDGLDGRIFAKAAERLEEPELLELRRAYEARAEKRFARPQLRQRAPEERGDETAFLV